MPTPPEDQGFTGRIRSSTSLDDALSAFVSHVAKGDSGRHRNEVDRVVEAMAEVVGDE